MSDHADEIEVSVYTFRIGDIADPDRAAGVYLYEWQRTERGRWIMAHCVEAPMWYRMISAETGNYRYEVRARLRGPAATEYLLRWG